MTDIDAHIATAEAVAILATSLLIAHPEMLIFVTAWSIPGALPSEPAAFQLAALEQGGSIQFDEGCSPRDITQNHIVRLEKWVRVLDAIIEDGRGGEQRLADQDHVDPEIVAKRPQMDKTQAS